MAIGFFRNSGMDTPQEANRAQLLLQGGPYGPLRNKNIVRTAGPPKKNLEPHMLEINIVICFVALNITH